MPEVSVIMVSMNRPDLVEASLRGIRQNTACTYEVILVAYMFTPENMERIRKSLPDVTIIPSYKRRGFAQNNNLALRAATGKYCFVVNDDTIVSMPVIDILLADFRLLPENAAAVSPAIFYPSGARQTCGRGPWSAWRYAMHYLHLVDETKKTRYTWREGLFPSCTLNGACFMIRTSAFKAAGWFDETYTFTPEDVALGMLLGRKGYGVYADSRARIIHIAKSSTSGMEAVIKPVRVKGSLIFYSSLGHISSPQGTASMDGFTHLMLGTFIWTYEALRGVKYAAKKLLGKMTERDRIMARTARNVRRIVFSEMTPGEVFEKYADEMA